MNLNQIDAVRLARDMGCLVRISRNGDNLFSHPAIAKPIRVNCRRKDSSKALMHFLRKVRGTR